MFKNVAKVGFVAVGVACVSYALYCIRKVTNTDVDDFESEDDYEDSDFDWDEEYDDYDEDDFDLDEEDLEESESNTSYDDYDLNEDDNKK